MSALETLAAPPKMSRYHSLRGKSVSQTPTVVNNEFDFGEGTTAQHGSTDSSGSSASSFHFTSTPASRKRSKTLVPVDDASAADEVTTAPGIPPIPPLPLAQRDLNARSIPAVALSPRSDESVDTPAPLFSGRDRAVSPVRVPTAITVDAPIDPHSGSNDAELRKREQELLEEEERRRRWEEEQAAIWADEVARLEAETDRILAEQRRKDLARQQLQVMAVPPSPSFPFKPPKSPVLEKFAFFKGRKTNNTVVAHSPTSSRSPRSPTSPMSSNLDLVRSNTLEPPTPTTPGMQMHFIEPGGRGIVPQTDAPQCASNGGLRRVIVMCRGMTVELEVKLLTTTIDILSACSDQMPQSFNINTSMLIEAYNQLGLERRIRRYEHIRDIMNSWDRDNLNALVVAPDTPESDPDLDFDNAPRGEHSPPGFILPLYHSQRPGKWNKRFITLLEGGQMFASKKADPTPVDKDVQGLCHLSDFDIYIPNEAQTKKLLKPPKKYCYAIKSQQTTAVFLNSENFVHFFCTDDPNIAQKLHSHVHSWRSWYLVTKLLQIEAKKKEILAEPPPKLPDPVKHKPKKSVSHVKINGHKVKVSVDESPYAIGAFAPLLDLGRFEKPLDEFGKDWVPDRNSVLPPVKPLQPSASIKKAAPTEKEQEFAAKGLLGDGYEERKQAKKAESNEESVEGPFTEGPNLLNGGIPAKAEASEEEAPKLVEPEKEKEQEKKPEPSSWFPSALEHSTKKKESEPPRPSTSAGPSSQLEREREREQRRQQQGQRKPGPLISLNPKVAESRAREGLGLGRGVPVPEGLLAVQLATGPATPTNSRFLAVPNRSAVRTKGSSSSSSSSSSQQQQKQPRQPHHQQSQSHHQQQRPSTSDGPRNMPRRPTVNGTSRRGDPGDLPPLPPLPPSNLHNRAATRDGAYDPGFPLPPSNRPSTSAGHRPSDRDYQRPSTSAGHRPQERDQSRPGTSAGHRPSERDHSRPRGGPEHGLRVPPRMANQQQQRGRSGSIMI